MDPVSIVRPRSNLPGGQVPIDIDTKLVLGSVKQSRTLLSTKE